MPANHRELRILEAPSLGAISHVLVHNHAIKQGIDDHGLDDVDLIFCQ